MRLNFLFIFFCFIVLDACKVEKVEYVLDDPSLPELYSKNTIFFVSVIFSTFFGAILLSSNLKYTKNDSKWFIVLLVGFGFSLLLLLAFIIFGLKLYVLVGLNIFGLVCQNTCFCGKEHLPG